ncbi:MAG: Antibiotic biosynthesis monooxygenase [Acidobacteria bacterium]|jgi:quinol monooxygenase YgiN|nr:Antibiotic biosynthesis monooxygenase [Acidobacteriota bacterium]
MANDGQVVLIARLKVKKEAVEEAKRAALAIVEPSRDEAGCLNYDFHQTIDDPSVFVWHETWANQSAIEEHGNSEHFKQFGKAIENIVEEPLQLTFAKMVSEKA